MLKKDFKITLGIHDILLFSFTSNRGKMYDQFTFACFGKPFL